MFFGNTFYSFSQNKAIDSLINVLKTAKEDTGKVKNLTDLSDKLWRLGDYDTSLQVAITSKKLAEKLSFKKGLSSALTRIGLVN